MRKLVDQFEDSCRELIRTDTLSHSMINDPLVSIALIVTFVADLSFIPGFGIGAAGANSDTLPSIGQFDTAKRQFQNSIHELIQNGSGGLAPVMTAGRDWSFKILILC